MLILLIPAVSAITFQDNSFLPLGLEKINCNRLFGGNDSNYCFDFGGNASTFNGLFTDLDFIGTTGFSDFIDNNNQTLASGLIKNNTLQGKVYLNSTLYINKNISFINAPSSISFLNIDKSQNASFNCYANIKCGFIFQDLSNLNSILSIIPAGTGIIDDILITTVRKKIAFESSLYPLENNKFDFGAKVLGNNYYWRNISSLKYTLQNGSNFNDIYGARGTNVNNTNDLINVSRFNTLQYSNSLYSLIKRNLTIGDSGVFGANLTGRYANFSSRYIIQINGTLKIAGLRKKDAFNITNGTGQNIIGFMNSGNFTFKVYNNTRILNCGMLVKNNGSWGMVCDGRGMWSGWKAK